MKIIVQYRPTDRGLFADVRVIRFAEDTAHQIEPYCERLGANYTAHVIDAQAAEPMQELRGFNSKMLTDLHNALGPEGEPRVGLPRIREDGVRRLFNRIVMLGKAAEPMVWNVQPTLSDRAEHDAEMIRNADCFVVAAWRGQPKGFDRKSAKDLATARNTAAELYEDRPIAIYAVRGNRQVHVENYETGANMPRNYTLGAFKPMRRDSALAKIVTAINDGHSSVETIATASGIDKVLDHLKAARRTHGIDHLVDEDGKNVEIVLPEGTDDPFLPAGKPKAERQPRAPKVGDFRPMRRDSALAEVVWAYLDGHASVEAIARHLKSAAEEVLAILKRARRTHGIGHTIADDGALSLELPADTPLFIASKAKDEAAKSPRAPKLGEFKPARAGSKLGKIAAKAGSTLDEIAAHIGVPKDEVVAALKSARRTHGIDHEIHSDTGIVTLLTPDGKAAVAEPAVKTEQQSSSSNGVRLRTDKMLEAAKHGVMPPQPDFSANTHKPWRKKLEMLVSLVENRDVGGLRAFAIKPVSSSPKALLRYRDSAIAAIEAQSVAAE